MAIRVQCSNCQAAFSARDDMAGRKGKCPNCQSPIIVPNLPASLAPRRTRASSSTSATKSVAAEPAASQRPSSLQAGGAGSDRAALARTLAAAFTGTIRPVRVSILYQLGLLLTTLMVVLLPVAYLGVVAATGFAVYYHTMYDTWLLSMGTGRGRLMMVVVYLAPIVSGLILVFFMFKPFFAAEGSHRRTRSLTRSGEPVLFDFVDRICAAVGATRPVRIEVDCQLNASASLDSTWFRLFRNRLVLTIGVPLVAGLKVDQLAGVLAHEFGHFTQGAGMRLTYIVPTINGWFARVVYQRDAWDEWLEETADELDFRVGWVLQLARLGVWLSRRVLWVFMIVGHGVSCFMMRQMEFNADAHEARMVGGETFAATTRRLVHLNVAYSTALIQAQQFAARAQPPDEISLLMLASARGIPARLVKTIDEQLSSARTGWFDTHPSNQARIRRTASEQAAVGLPSAIPAAALFSDFKALSRNTTWDLYRAKFGSRFAPSMMHSTEALLKGSDEVDHPPAEIPLDG